VWNDIITRRYASGGTVEDTESGANIDQKMAPVRRQQCHCARRVLSLESLAPLLESVRCDPRMVQFGAVIAALRGAGMAGWAGCERQRTVVGIDPRGLADEETNPAFLEQWERHRLGSSPASRPR